MNIGHLEASRETASVLYRIALWDCFEVEFWRSFPGNVVIPNKKWDSILKKVPWCNSTEPTQSHVKRRCLGLPSLPYWVFFHSYPQRVYGWAYADVRAKFSGIDSFPFSLRCGFPQRARALRWKLLRDLSAIMGKILSQFASKIYRNRIVSEENEQFKSVPCHLKLTTLWYDRPPPPCILSIPNLALILL